MIRLLLVVLLLPAICCAQKTTYTVKGELPGGSGQIRLSYNKGNRTFISNETVMKNGRFILRGDIDAPYKANMMLVLSDSTAKNRSQRLTFFLDTGTTVIRSRNVLDNATVTGTQLCADAALYQRLADSLLIVEDSFVVRQKRLDTDFIIAHPGSRLNLYILRENSYFFEYKELEALYNKTAPEIRLSAAGKDYAARLQRLKSVALGEPAPDFSQPDTSGKMISLSSFRGKYVLLDFWASWCGPCRAESPYLAAAYSKYKEKGFTIIGLSLDKKADRKLWLRAIEHDKLTWTQVSDGSDYNPVVRLYGVKGIPQNFLISPDGKIIAHNLRGEALEEKLSQLIQ